MQNIIPEFFEEKLIKNYGENITKKLIENYKLKRKTTLRVNTLKTDIEKIKIKLNDEKIKFKEIKWNKNALILENANEEDIKKLSIYENGEIYFQSLSSMIPAIILEPKKDENILDMAAAPGGKTTQIAAISENGAMITACEKNKIRAERLKYNINKQGARVNVLVEDSRKLNDFLKFDKILLDSPCSGSGTDTVYSENFTKDLIQRSVKVQEELLKKGINILKQNGEIIYSTCSILKEENEEIIKNIINLNLAEIVPIVKEDLEGIEFLNTEIDGTICVMPNEFYEGFFIAKLRKKK